MEVIAAVSLAGGQSKTTTCFFLSKMLAELGQKVLVIDGDPQANLTFYLNQEVEANQSTLFEVLTGTVETEDGICPKGQENLFLMPADNGLLMVKSNNKFNNLKVF